MKRKLKIIIFLLILLFNLNSVKAYEIYEDDDISSGSLLTLSGDSVIKLNEVKNVQIDINGYNLYISGSFDGKIKDSTSSADATIYIGYDEYYNSINTTANIDNSINNSDGLLYSINEVSTVTFDNIDTKRVINYGNTTINSGKLNSTQVNNASIDNYGGTMLINNISSNGVYGIIENQGHDLIIKNNSISNNGVMYLNNISGNMQIDGGTYAGLSNGTSDNYGYTTINNGTFLLEDICALCNDIHSLSNDGEGYGLIISHKGSITINDGTFDANISTTNKIKKTLMYAKKTDVIISNGIFSTNGSLFHEEGGSTITVNGGTYTVNQSDNEYTNSVINSKQDISLAPNTLLLNGGKIDITRVNKTKLQPIIDVVYTTIDINGATININDLPLYDESDPIATSAFKLGYFSSLNVNGGSLNITPNSNLNIYLQDNMNDNSPSQGKFIVNNTGFKFTKGDIKAYNYETPGNVPTFYPKKIMFNDGTILLKDTTQPIISKKGYHIVYEPQSDGAQMASLERFNLTDIMWYRKYLAGVEEILTEYDELSDAKKLELDINNYPDGKINILDLVQARIIVANEDNNN